MSNPQYYVSDVVGVETFENVCYLKKIHKHKKIDLLFNWPNIVQTTSSKLDKIVEFNFNICTSNNRKKNITNYLYLGNTSIAHDYKSIIGFLNHYNKELNYLKFEINLFGKNSNFLTLENDSIQQNFWGLVPEHNIPFILSKVDCGIVSLNRKAKTHNIPGKFISYTQYKLPIICFANINSPLAKLILNYDCGIVIDLEIDSRKNWNKFLNFIKKFNQKKLYYSKNSFKLFTENFDTKSTVNQILTTFK